MLVVSKTEVSPWLSQCIWSSDNYDPGKDKNTNNEGDDTLLRPRDLRAVPRTHPLSLHVCMAAPCNDRMLFL